jgi:hypothetical protein
MYNKLVSAFILSLTTSILLAQNQPMDKDYQILSPNTAALSKFGDTPVSLYTGTPQIEIPLYIVKEKSLTIPITLRYHASGIRADQQPSNVGLGMVLDGSGVIVRKIRGVFDERTNKGWLNSESFGGPSNPSVWNSLTSTLSKNSAVNTEDSRYWALGLDQSPDEFQFNFAGRTGKFYFNHDGTIQCSDGLKIEFSQQPQSSGSTIYEIYKWKITTEDGTQFFFEQKESSQLFIVRYPEMIDGVSSYISAWYLTKVEALIIFLK